MTAPIDQVDIAVAGNPALARDTVANALSTRGFTLAWSDDWNGVATKGSKTKQAWLGALALYLEVNINVGVVKLVLNEQIPFNIPDKGLTVNAVHATLNALGLAKVDVVVASSESGIGNCP